MDDELSTGTSAASAPLSRDAQLAADREAFLAADVDSDEDGVPAKPAPKKPAAPSPDEDLDDDEDDLDDDGEDEETKVDDEDEDDLDDEDDDLDEDDEDEDEDDEDKAADPETQKRLAKVQKTAQRQRLALEREKAQFAAEREQFVAAYKPKLEALEAFEKLKARVRFEPDAVLFELGLKEEDAEDAARAIFARSKKGAEDPKNKDAVARSRRDRELADELAQVKKKLEERDAKDAEAARLAEANRKVERYLGKIQKSVGDEHPITKAQLEKAPKRTRAALENVALELARKNGNKMVAAAKVAATYEKRQAKLLRASGVEVPSSAAKPKTEPKSGEKTIAVAKGKPAPVAKPQGDDEGDDRVWSRKEILAAMPD